MNETQRRKLNLEEDRGYVPTHSGPGSSRKKRGYLFRGIKRAKSQVSSKDSSRSRYWKVSKRYRLWPKIETARYENQRSEIRERRNSCMRRECGAHKGGNVW